MVSSAATKAEKIIAEQSVQVPLDHLKPYRKNPRIGNVDAIRDSLRENGQFRPIVVQKSTNEILGGNHTWKAAQAEGWSTISVVYVDVDDETAKRIVLADNRTNDLATYDADILAEILGSLPKPSVGTGYDDDAVKSLLDGIQERSVEAVQDVLRPPPTVPVLGNHGEISREQDNRVAGAESGPLEVTGELNDPFQDAPDTINGAFDLKVDVIYEKSGFWDIPPLRTDMLVQVADVPRNLKAWAGSATKDWPDPDQWWLYNVGIDSTSGMKDITKVIPSFYCFDTYFESWWVYPDRYTAKMINSGIKYAVMPDFSQWAADPRIISLYNFYRNRWLARYFQEAGIKVIPNISWRYEDSDYFDKILRPTYPERLPVIAIQLQTFAKDQTEQQLADLKAFTEHIVGSFNPDLTIFYVGRQADEMVKTLTVPGEVMVIQNRLDALGEQAKNRQKKTTL